MTAESDAKQPDSLNSKSDNTAHAMAAAVVAVAAADSQVVVMQQQQQQLVGGEPPTPATTEHAATPQLIMDTSAAIDQDNRELHSNAAREPRDASTAAAAAASSSLSSPENPNDSKTRGVEDRVQDETRPADAPLPGPGTNVVVNDEQVVAPQDDSGIAPPRAVEATNSSTEVSEPVESVQSTNVVNIVVGEATIPKPQTPKNNVAEAGEVVTSIETTAENKEAATAENNEADVVERKADSANQSGKTPPVEEATPSSIASVKTPVESATSLPADVKPVAETEVQEITIELAEESLPATDAGEQIRTKKLSNFNVMHIDDAEANSRLNAERIQNVENCFGSSGQSLRAAGRVLVGEGVLTKMCRKKPKPRQVFLFNDILVYGNILIPKKKYIKQHIIPLEKVCLENLEDAVDMSNGWVIRTPTKSFVVYAASKMEKQQWMSHINTCINELLKKTGKIPSREHAAVWVPDSDAGRCMVCKETKFTLLNRRHHCRKCGCVVCGNCSQHKFMLPSQSSKPLRVCDCCYNALSMGKGEMDIDLSMSQGSGGHEFVLPVSAAAAVQAGTDNQQKQQQELLHDPASKAGSASAVAAAAVKEQLSSSRDDTTDDSEDDDEDANDDQSAEQAKFKEEKPTFYSAGEDPNKDTNEKSASIENEQGKGDKVDQVSQAQEKMDAMKITLVDDAKGTV